MFKDHKAEKGNLSKVSRKWNPGGHVKKVFEEESDKLCQMHLISSFTWGLRNGH